MSADHADGTDGADGAAPAAVGEPLDLVALARGSGRARVPGSDLEVAALDATTPERLERPTWLLLLAGELIVDLPFGDFRKLAVGESLELPAGLRVSFEPLEPSVVLRRSR